MNLKGKDVEKRNKGRGKILGTRTSRQERSESRAWSWRNMSPCDDCALAEKTVL